MIDVAHEVLIRHWQQLRTWLDASRESLLFQRKIETAAREWKRQGKKPDYLWRGRRLWEAREFVKQHKYNWGKFTLPRKAELFINMSVSKQRRDGVKAIGLFMILPLIGTYFGFKHVQLSNDAELVVVKCLGKDICPGRIEALERLVKARKPLAGINLSNAYLYNADLKNANLYFADLRNVSLSYGDLRSADLEMADLYGAYLRNSNFKNANLFGVNLRDSDLHFTDLRDAELNSAELNSAELEFAKLRGALLYDTKLYYANLDGVDLHGANLKSSYLIDVKNLTPQQIKSACNWEKAFYKGEYYKEQNEWIIDKQANEEYITRLKKDKASEPEEPVDCSRWETD